MAFDMMDGISMLKDPGTGENIVIVYLLFQQQLEQA